MIAPPICLGAFGGRHDNTHEGDFAMPLDKQSGGIFGQKNGLAAGKPRSNSDQHLPSPRKTNPSLSAPSFGSQTSFPPDEKFKEGIVSVYELPKKIIGPSVSASLLIFNHFMEILLNLHRPHLMYLEKAKHRTN